MGNCLAVVEVDHLQPIGGGEEQMAKLKIEAREGDGGGRHRRPSATTKRRKSKANKKMDMTDEDKSKKKRRRDSQNNKEKDEKKGGTSKEQRIKKVPRSISFSRASNTTDDDYGSLSSSSDSTASSHDEEIAMAASNIRRRAQRDGITDTPETLPSSPPPPSPSPSPIEHGQKLVSVRKLRATPSPPPPSSSAPQQQGTARKVTTKTAAKTKKTTTTKKKATKTTTDVGTTTTTAIPGKKVGGGLPVAAGATKQGQDKQTKRVKVQPQPKQQQQRRKSSNPSPPPSTTPPSTSPPSPSPNAQLSPTPKTSASKSQPPKTTATGTSPSPPPSSQLLPSSSQQQQQEPPPSKRQQRPGLFARMMSSRSPPPPATSAPTTTTTTRSSFRNSFRTSTTKKRQAQEMEDSPLTTLPQQKPPPHGRKSLFAVPLSKRNSTNYTPMDVKAALKAAHSSKWIVETHHSGTGKFTCPGGLGKIERIVGKRIDKGIKKFKDHPEKYIAIIFERKQRFAHDTTQVSYTLIHRHGTALPFKPKDTVEDPKLGPITIMIQKYQHLTPMPSNMLPLKDRDQYTNDLITFDGKQVHNFQENPPILPGRGMGIGDTPNLKIIGDIDPSDITQGEVGNCWLLSAISALAEFDGAIKRLFRKTPFLDYMPMDSPNKYIITLYDLTTWEEVDIVVDESLCANPKKPNELLGAQISEDGELWVSYLEKAFLAHAGGGQGWNGLEGGHATHAWSMMTGCKEQYFIRKNYRTGKYHCSGKYDMFTREWKPLHNQPRHEDTAGLEPVEWPQVGGGGPMGMEVTAHELFMKMWAWDNENYIVGASSKATLKENIAAGLIQNHGYSVIDAFHNVAGTGIDLFKVRNPWGHSEPEEGLFNDTGPGWEKYPQIKALLKPVVANDGIFYLTKDEFFEFFDHIYLSACDMTEFKED